MYMKLFHAFKTTRIIRSLISTPYCQSYSTIMTIASTGVNMYPYMLQLASLDAQQPQQPLADPPPSRSPALHYIHINGKSYCKAIQTVNLPNIHVIIVHGLHNGF